jgi:NAD(P)-dependent dehydrogenase (short-subunit alcohol dehydrogenase family)
VNGEALKGRVAAVIGCGSEADRAIAVALAEAGADIALGTVDRSQAQDFGTNSIANEIWSVGREHFVRVMDALEATEVTAFADEVWDRLGRCDLLVANYDMVTTAPLLELSADEWEYDLRFNLTGPFLAAQAFARLMVRQGSGRVAVMAWERDEADLAYRVAQAGKVRVAEEMDAALAKLGVRVEVAWDGKVDVSQIQGSP